MRVGEFKKSLLNPPSRRTLCFFLVDNQVLLGKKKRGFGEGKWVGIGGKVEEAENIRDAAIREVDEEIGVIPKELQQAGKIGFYFADESVPNSWNQEVYVFLVEQWEGDIRESSEIEPKWFPIEQLPLEMMWKDASYWLPKILAGQKVTADFLFNKKLGIQDMELTHED